MEVNFGARAGLRRYGPLNGQTCQWAGGVLSLIPWLVASKQDSKYCIVYM